MWLNMQIKYKKAPVESYTAVMEQLRRPRDTKTADQLRTELVQRLRKG